MKINKTFNQLFNPTKPVQVVMLNRVRAEVNDELKLNHLFVGRPGIGKSAYARVLSKDYNTRYVNVSQTGTIDHLRDDLSDFCSNASMDDRPKLLFLDELDGASEKFFEALRGFMDVYQDHVRFLGTCNNFGRLQSAADGAIVSRFNVVKFEPQSTTESVELKSKYIERVMLYFKTLKTQCHKDAASKIVESTFPDFRSTLQHMQRIYKAMKDADKTEVTVDILAEAQSELTKFYDMVLDPKIDNVELHQTIVADYSDQVHALFNHLHTGLPEYIIKNRQDRIGLIDKINSIVAYHAYNLPNSIDPVLNLKACIFELNKAG